MKVLRLLSILMLATAIFGLSGCGGTTQTTQTDEPAPANAGNVTEEVLDLSHLSPEDQTLAQQQKFCPVGGEDALLGSGGMKAVKVNVEGRDVFLCCEGCEEALRADPEKYFAILDGKDAPEKGDATEPAEATDPADDANADPS